MLCGKRQRQDIILQSNARSIENDFGHDFTTKSRGIYKDGDVEFLELSWKCRGNALGGRELLWMTKQRGHWFWNQSEVIHFVYCTKQRQTLANLQSWQVNARDLWRFQQSLPQTDYWWSGDVQSHDQDHVLTVQWCQSLRHTRHRRTRSWPVPYKRLGSLTYRRKHYRGDITRHGELHPAPEHNPDQRWSPSQQITSIDSRFLS